MLRPDLVGIAQNAGGEEASHRGVHHLPALHFAAIGGRLEVAEMLLAEGAVVSARAEAAAPIHGAVLGRSAEMVLWLLSAAPTLRFLTRGEEVPSAGPGDESEDLAGLF